LLMTSLVTESMVTAALSGHSAGRGGSDSTR
jgi:hypothetical protein